MASGEKKVSLMSHITSAPNDTKMYIVMPDGSYGYILKSEFLSEISASNVLTKSVFAGTDITVPLGFSGAVINLNNTNADVTYTVAGILMTITGGADNGDVLIF
jgi:hypothetical protein